MTDSAKTKHAAEPSRAWQAGYQAARHGLVRGANPYPVGSADAQEWTAGYLKGAAEMGELADK
jgi:hypothetical protein